MELADVAPPTRSYCVTGPPRLKQERSPCQPRKPTITITAIAIAWHINTLMAVVCACHLAAPVKLRHRLTSIAPEQSHQTTLDVDLIGAKDSRLELRIGRFERNRRALLPQPLERCFFLLDECDDDVPVLRRITAPDDDRIAIVNTRLDGYDSGLR
jgi:hypothetical protein